MKEPDIAAYWQSYADLIELWAKGTWDEADMTAHYLEHGQKEGRLIPKQEDIPDHWSDWLYFSERKGEYSWWWQKGVIETGAYRALLDGQDSLELGTIGNSKKLQQSSALSQQALTQVASHAEAFPGSGPLPDILAQKLEWATPRSIGLLPLKEAVLTAHPDRYGYIILLPWLESGGAELVGMWHYLAAEKLGLNPLIIMADKPNVTARFAAQNMNTLNLPELYQQVMDKPYSDLTRNDRMEILTTVIEALDPDILHLIHSYTGYSALTTHGTKERIREACTRIFVSAFCPHIHPAGHYDGYFRDIPDLLDVVDRFVFDSDWYLAEMAETYNVPASQSVAIKYPVSELPKPAKPPAKRNKVLWASRFDSQKNPGIVAKIATLMPDTEFLMYGRQVMGDDQINWKTMPKNVKNCGEFFNIDELPIKDCFAFLYTSKFDGTPNILLEIGSRGLPIITPNIGGIAGFLGNDWPLYVDSPTDIDGYVHHIGKLRESAELGKTLTSTQLGILKSERSFGAFFAMVSALLAQPTSA
ncbi:MAG: hypothetical protein L3J37_10625 [Rhodobacteraceae bacterium]|nr:hypothetical protein [Paracoccaceae bacterium]